VSDHLVGPSPSSAPHPRRHRVPPCPLLLRRRGDHERSGWWVRSPHHHLCTNHRYEDEGEYNNRSKHRGSSHVFVFCRLCTLCLWVAAVKVRGLLVDTSKKAVYLLPMEEKSNKPQNILLQQLYPFLQKTGHKGISLLSSIRVFAPKPISAPLQRAQRLLERFFPKEPQP
jgi:hypothetical protein